MATIERGMLVMGHGSEIGTVEDVLSNGNEPERVLVRRLDGQTICLNPRLIASRMERFTLLLERSTKPNELRIRI